MKHGIELNGVANILMLVEFGQGPSEEGDSSTAIDALHKIEEQVILLERYMLAHNEANHNDRIPPMWHEVLSKPYLYPTNRERYK